MKTEEGGGGGEHALLPTHHAAHAIARAVPFTERLPTEGTANPGARDPSLESDSQHGPQQNHWRAVECIESCV